MTPDHLLDTSRYELIDDSPLPTRAWINELQQMISAQIQEYPSMPQSIVSNTTTSSTTGSASMFSTTTATMTPPVIQRSAQPTTFTMRQNTHEIELRELRNKYSSIVFQYDFNRSIRETFDEHIDMLKSNLNAFRRLVAARNAFLTAPSKYKRHIRVVIENNFNSRDLVYILHDGNPDAVNYQSTRSYRQVLDCLAELRNAKSQYREFKRRYGPQQAEHNQRAAMIRQKPERYISIDMKRVVNTIATWDNVWGVDYYISTTDKIVYMRIGLCNIVMQESAQDSYYSNPKDILLAPFYITVRLSTVGRATCPSRDGNTLGLSRSNNPGYCSYDIHPHQLSDQPCFGTFGQALVDMANNGDLVSYVGTLIAFYSQYNSQDSAGVHAQQYHPSHMVRMAESDVYQQALVTGMCSLTSRPSIDYNKLRTAIDTYITKHREICDAGEFIEPAQNQVCYSCDENPVGADQEYWLDNNGNRICVGCWENAYCGNCERHQEDCCCNHDDED